MERPSSRGSGSLGGTMGRAGAAPDRPGTASRQQAPPTAQQGGGRGGSSIMNSMAPPGTASRQGVPPSSTYKRLGTANTANNNGQRPGTQSNGMGAGVAVGGVGRTAVQVDNRPITNHGLSGIKAGGGGGGRQVLDKTYFVNELRQKRLEIVNVTSTMRAELDALEKRQQQYNSMDRRCNDLMKEVKLLQEALADYNTVLDKVGSQTPVHQINAEHAELKQRNDQQRKRIDDILTERLQLEAKAKQTDMKILGIQQSMDERLAAMPPSQRIVYSELGSEQATLQADSRRMEDAIEELDKQLALAEGELARNPLKQKSLQLQEQIRSLTERKYELQQEEEKSRLSPEEQREQLMNKIKRDNQEAETLAQQIREVTDAIKKMEARASSLGGQGAIGSAAEEASKREKFDELLAKERDLNNFMDSFPSRKAAKLAEQQTKGDGVVAALERITKLAAISSSALPSQKKFKEMQDELEYKKMQLENTQSTQERLKEELTNRRTELDKIDTLEDKIKLELTQLAEKTEQLKGGMDGFANVADVKRKAEAARERLEGLKLALMRRKDLLRNTVQKASLKHQAKKAQLQENNLQIALEKLEAKLRTATSTAYTMDEFIKAKESETNYKSLGVNIMSLSEELNGIIQKAII